MNNFESSSPIHFLKRICQVSVTDSINRFRSLYQSYGLWGLVRLGGDWLATKLVWPQARLLRRPFYIRGRRWIRVGPGFTTGPGVRLDALPAVSGNAPVLVIGQGVQLNDYVHIAAIHSVTIGDRVLIASKVFITDHNHGMYKTMGALVGPSVPPAERTLSSSPVVIEDDVWIGEFVAVLPGVRIGKGAIVGTMSTVTHDVPPYSIVGGSPARLLKRYNFETSTWDKV